MFENTSFISVLWSVTQVTGLCRVISVRSTNNVFLFFFMRCDKHEKHFSWREDSFTRRPSSCLVVTETCLSANSHKLQNYAFCPNPFGSPAPPIPQQKQGSAKMSTKVDITHCNTVWRSLPNRVHSFYTPTICPHLLNHPEKANRTPSPLV